MNMNKRERGTQTHSLKQEEGRKIDVATQTSIRSKSSYYREDNSVITHWKLKSEILTSKEHTIQFCQQKGLIKYDFSCRICDGKMALKKSMGFIYTSVILC